MSNPISEYYHGRDIFVTGGSGLMGKALLEKLLRSCTQLNRIFVLLRDRKGMSAYDRLKKLKENRIFDRLKSEKPNALDKLVAIPGDLIEHDLGMSEDSKKSMANVSLIFHVAATIRFDETLRRAILINVRGTREALNFAMQLRNLQRFVHVSTAFSYPYKTRLDEQIYPPMDDWKTIIKLAEKFDDGILNVFTKKLLTVFPNTYTYTKHLAEHVVDEFSYRLPVTITRPSIVHNSTHEPYEGWYDKTICLVGLATSVSTGIIRTILCNPHIVLDLVPLDYCVKFLVALPWWFDKSEERLPIFNATLGQTRGFSIETIVQNQDALTDYQALNKTLWVPCCVLTKCNVYFYLRFYLLQVMPAILFDALIKFSGRKPFLLYIQRRALATQMSYGFFLWNEYIFNSRLLHSTGGFKQNEDFRVDITYAQSLDRFVHTTGIGCRRYILREGDNTIPQSIRRFKIMKAIDFTIYYCCRFWLLHIILKKLLLN